MIIIYPDVCMVIFMYLLFFCCLIDAIDFFVLICNSTEGFVRAEIVGSVFGCLHIYIYTYLTLYQYIYICIHIFNII
jgi:hypothetical protein